MGQKNRTSIDCACVIHGNVYDWQYVDNLYNMICRNIDREVRLHVYTEPERSVPSYVIKHELIDCPEANERKRGWWYKMQLFNREHFAGDLLYFDLDVVIVRDISWVADLSPQKLWAIRDFKYLQHSVLYQINSSVMWWNVSSFDWVWQKFKTSNIRNEVKKYNGDQDYLENTIGFSQRRYFPESNIISWRWQAWEGGVQFPYKRTKDPGAGTVLPDNTSVLVFHGKPKPHELLDDVVIKQHWR